MASPNAELNATIRQAYAATQGGVVPFWRPPAPSATSRQMNALLARRLGQPAKED